MMQAEIMSLEVFRHLIQQPCIGWLYGPGLRWRVVRIQPQQIKTVIRIDKTDDHQLAPNEIYGGAAELNMARSDSSQFPSRIDARTRLLAFPYENRLVGSGLSRKTRFGHCVEWRVAIRFVSRRKVVDYIVPAGWPLRSIARRRDRTDFPEKCPLLAKVTPRFGSQEWIAGCGMPL